MAQKAAINKNFQLAGINTLEGNQQQQMPPPQVGKQFNPQLLPPAPALTLQQHNLQQTPRQTPQQIPPQLNYQQPAVQNGPGRRRSKDIAKDGKATPQEGNGPVQNGPD